MEKQFLPIDDKDLEWFTSTKRQKQTWHYCTKKGRLIHNGLHQNQCDCRKEDLRLSHFSWTEKKHEKEQPEKHEEEEKTDEIEEEETPTVVRRLSPLCKVHTFREKETTTTLTRETRSHSMGHMMHLEKPLMT